MIGSFAIKCTPNLRWEFNIIRVRVNGGLGNQLFKFFHGLKTALKYNKNLSIDLSWYEHRYMNSNKVNSRTFELSFFDPISKIPTFISRSREFDLLRNRIERKLTPKSQKFLGCMTEQSEYLFTSPPKVIDGDYVNLASLPDFSIISKYIEFPKAESIWLMNEFSMLPDGMVVAVHVRRTDYINLPEIYDVLTKEYYMNAINYFRKKYHSASFWLFSDDTEGAQVFLNDIVNFDRIVSSPKDVPTGETLKLMSSFKGIIIANSTFSWWAAYIGHMNGRTLEVILPSRFSTLGNDNPSKYLKLPEWNILDA